MKQTIILTERDFSQAAIELGIWSHLKEIAADDLKCSYEAVSDDAELTLHITRVDVA